MNHLNHLNFELLVLAGAQVLATWGILRHEVRGIRAEVARAHGRIDVLEALRK